MNEIDSKTVKRVLLGVSVLLNLGILLYAFSNTTNTTEIAGSLIYLLQRIEILVIGVVITSLCYLLIKLIFKYQSNDGIIISLIFVLVASILYYYTCISIVFPTEYTQEEWKGKQSNELRKMERKGKILLSKSENLLTDRKIKLEDSTAIMHYFSHFLDSAFYLYSDSIKIDYSEKFEYLFNRILINRPNGKVVLISDTSGSNEYRQIIKNKLSIDLFLYSPNREKLLIVITYEVDKDPVEANALVLIGKRYGNKILLYRYKNFSNNYGVINKKYALYQVITEFEDRENLHYSYRDNDSPLDESFWDGYWFEKVKLNNTKIYRYQLNPYAYKLNEKKQFNQRVMEETKTFIEIEK